jgi:CRISPR-associated protein Cmr3
MWLFLRPLDVLFLRDSKPFTAGEDHSARSLFPPSPHTVLGAIKSKILSNELPKRGKSFEDFKNKNLDKNDALIKEVGDVKSYGNLRIKGPFLSKVRKSSLSTYFPIPLDLFQKETDSDLVLIKPLRNSLSAKFNDPILATLWTKKMGVKEIKGKVLSDDGLHSYLQGEHIRDNLLETKEIYHREYRIGIKLGKTRTPEEGMLYMSQVIRMHEDAGLLLWLDVNKEMLGSEGIMSLGGDGHGVFYEDINHKRKMNGLSLLIGGEEIKKRINVDNPRFKLYLISPAIFRNGWLPDFINTNILGLNLKLVSACIGKPISIGGWDLASNEPKPMKKAVPPGSVYFFELFDRENIENVKDKIFKEFHFECGIQKYSDNPSLAQIGFGLTFVGTWDYANLPKAKEEKNV